MKPQGLKGEIRILPVLEHLEEYARLDEIYITHEGSEAARYLVEGIRKKGNLLIFRLKNCGSVEAAQRLVGSDVGILRNQLKELPPDHYYWFEIEGLEVFSEEGRYFGVVQEIFPTGSNDVYLIKSDTQELLVPAIHEVVTQIDLKERRMIIRPLEGLFE
ncbi:MAG: 16S rRNA processing protein RimM [Candidatus Tectomicrobia bacterium]|uniref:Ribosome maturation factor RimM n=1 Tax=Tectimicrobiota bacterium TaxID=2528274 RepID=A0A932CPD3_UNCTE|nr:16S rRNA processing protein RimM [Candidatus Tectomicrobia bacterium]